MKKAIIVFHSVCGNTFLMAQEYQKAFQNCGVDADLFRVEDQNFATIADMFPASRETKAAIEAIPVLTDGAAVLPYDYIVLGSPTYFGNVSGPMKLFMDSFCPLFVESKLFGKDFTAFTASSTTSGGPDMCLLAMNNFALHLGMTVHAVPANLQGAVQPAYGIAHASGGDSTIRPDAATKEAIHNYIKLLVK